MNRRMLACLTALVVTTFGATLGGGPAGAAGRHPAPVARGGPGVWTKISSGTVGILDQAGLYRTPDGVLHVVYPRETGSGDTYGHTAVSPSGSTVSQSTVLASPWSIRVADPVVVAGPSGGMRLLFGGQKDLTTGYWDDGRMYTATSTASGASWAVPAQAVGLSHSAYSGYGTAGTTLADGTPVAGFPLNSTFTWHVGVSESTADQSFTFGSCCLYSATMVNDGGHVWVGWYANGNTAATNGTFVRQLYPSVGPILKAPGSSNGTDSLPTGRVALVARTGGGVVAAYCVGYPTCTAVRLWKVGTNTTANVPGSRYAAAMSMSPGPSGRIWVAWRDNIPNVKALRTGRTGFAFGPTQNLHVPRGHNAVYSLGVDGTSARGDIVINVGDAFWHTQVRPGLTLHASPTSWRHGTRTHVTFTVVDANDQVAGSRVEVGSQHCTTTSHGTCGITFARSYGSGSHRAVATKSGYAPAHVVLHVRSS